MSFFAKPFIVRSSTALGIGALAIVALLQLPVLSLFSEVSFLKDSFVVEDVAIAGHKRTPIAALKKAIDIEVGQSLVGLELAAVKDRILTLPWVKDATIKRLLKGSVLITVKEREPFALWQSNGLVYVIDREGVAIATGTLKGYERLPLVVGKGANLKAEALIASLETLSGMPAAVQSAVRVGGRRWNIHFDNDVIVKMPEEGNDILALQDAWVRLVSLQNKHRLMEREVAVIDLRHSDRLILSLTARGKRVLEGKEWSI